MATDFKAEKRSAPQQEKMIAGRPAAYWQRKLEDFSPVGKEEPRMGATAKKMPRNELESVCKALRNDSLRSEEIRLDWWLENASALHPQDASVIICTMSKRHDARQKQGFVERAKKAVGEIEDPKLASIAVIGMLKESIFADAACTALERDIQKYAPASAALAISAGLDNAGTRLRVAKLMQRMPAEDQETPLKKALSMQDGDVAEIGMALLEKQPDRIISDVIRYVFCSKAALPTGVRLAERIRRLPKKLQVAPMLEAIRNKDVNVSKIGIELLEGRGRKTRARAIEKILSDKDQAGPGAMLLVPRIANEPMKARLALLKGCIESMPNETALEAVKLLGMQPSEKIGSAVEELLKIFILPDSKRIALIGLLMHVQEKKRTRMIANEIERGGEAGKAAYAQIGLAPKDDRLELFGEGWKRLPLPKEENGLINDIGMLQAFATLTPDERVRVMFYAMELENEKPRRMFAHLIKGLDIDGLKKILPKALRCNDSHWFAYSREALEKMGENDRKGLCDFTADEILDALSKEWGDNAWIGSSLLPFMSGNRKEELKTSVENSIDRLKVVLVSPYLEESVRKKTESAICRALEEYLEYARGDFTWHGIDFVKLIPHQPAESRSGLYELAARQIEHQLTPTEFNGQKNAPSLGLRMAEAIPMLPEEHWPGLFALVKNGIAMEVREGFTLHTHHSKRLIRALSFLPRETQVEMAYTLSIWSHSEDEKKEMDDLMPGVREESEKTHGYKHWIEFTSEPGLERGNRRI